MRAQPKRILIPPMLTLCLLVGGMLVACNHEQKEATVYSDIAVHVQTPDFQNINATTKASESGYNTTFSNGDQIGIFVKSANGTYRQSNVPYTYDSDSDTWQPHAEQISWGQGEVCLAYYPYSATVTSWTNLQNFNPKGDQSTYADYTASDLMMSAETVPIGSGAAIINFVLAHRMALLIFQPTAAVQDLAMSVENGEQAGKPYLFDANQGLSRYLIKPVNNRYLSGVLMQQGGAPQIWHTNISAQAGKYYIIQLNTK